MTGSGLSRRTYRVISACPPLLPEFGKVLYEELGLRPFAFAAALGFQQNGVGLSLKPINPQPDP